MSRDAWDIEATYQDAAGKEQRVTRESIEAIRSAIGTPPPASRSLFDEPVKVVCRGEPFVLPDPAELRPQLLASLRRGIAKDYVGQVSRDVVRLLRADANPGELIWEAVAPDDRARIRQRRRSLARSGGRVSRLRSGRSSRGSR